MSPWISGLATIIAIAGVLVIVGGLIWAAYDFLKNPKEASFQRIRRRIGHSLLLGLEILVAGDIVRTVALRLTLESLGTLALLILIRTFLSWALDVEIEGRWPWKGREVERSERVSR